MRDLESVRDLRLFLVLTFALSWGVGGAYLVARALAPQLAPLEPAHPIFLLMNCAPSLAAFALAARQPGGMSPLLARLWRPFAPVWLAVAVLFLPMICALAGSPVPLSLLPLLFLDIAPWGEEFGWRGYLLPRLLQRMPVLSASLLVGAVWVVWHIPAFFLSGVMSAGAGNFAWWALGTLALSLVMGVLILRANANLLVAGILPHLAINAAARAGWWHSSPREVLLLTVFALGLWGLCARRKASS